MNELDRIIKDLSESIEDVAAATLKNIYVTVYYH